MVHRRNRATLSQRKNPLLDVRPLRRNAFSGKAEQRIGKAEEEIGRAEDFFSLFFLPPCLNYLPPCIEEDFLGKAKEKIGLGKHFPGLFFGRFTLGKRRVCKG